MTPAGGIIPARAGFTALDAKAAADVADHPRSRGVYIRHMSTAYMGCGSSPLARGLPAVQNGDRTGGGIIPARAGFTNPL